MFREPPLRSGSLFPPRHTSAPLSAALSAAPPPEAKPMPKGGHFRHPGRWWQPCGVSVADAARALLRQL